MGGDGQVLAPDVLRTYLRYLEGDVALAKVCRVSREDGQQRQFVTKVWNFVFTVLFGLRARDINGSPKIFSRSLLPWLKPEQKDWFLDAEVILKVSYTGGKIADVPIHFLPRREGHSNVRLGTLVEFGHNLRRYTWRFWKSRLMGLPYLR